MPEISYYTGLVSYVNSATYACTVILDNGIALHDVPILNTTGGVCQSEVTMLNNYIGATVLVMNIDSKSYILATIPIPASRVAGQTSSEAATENTTFDNTEKSIPNVSTATYTFTGNKPTEFLPGDKVISADGGASLAVQRGGSIVIKASPLSQIIMGGSQNYIKFAAREISFSSDFGEVKLGHSGDGLAGLSITGGANWNENNPTDGKNTIKMTMGSCPGNGNARFGMHVNDEAGGTYGAIAIEDTGRAVIAGSEDVRIQATNDLNIHVGNNLEEKVVGKYGREVDSDYYETVGGDGEISYDGDLTTSVLGDQEDITLGNRTINVSGVLTINASALVFNTNGTSAGPCTIKCSDLNIEKV